jgi:ABC-type uncharacterized transport system substrate-binding protein
MSYGVDQVDLFRQAAPYVDRILRREKPADQVNLVEILFAAVHESAIGT